MPDRRFARAAGLLVLFVLPDLAGLPAAAAGAFDHGWVVAPHDGRVLAADLAALDRSIAPAPGQGAPALAWVVFTDKGVRSQADYEAATARATAALTEPARARRARLGAGRLVDHLDLPVRADYIEAVRGSGARLRLPSRWLNAVSVEATPAALARLAALPAVARLLPLAHGRRAPLPTPEGTGPPPAGPATAVLDYGPSFDQLDEIQVTTAHGLGYSGAGVLVAMLDTGFYKDHEAFTALRNEGRLIAERDFINGDWNTQNEAGDSPTQHNHGTYTWSALGGTRSGQLYGPAYGASFAIAKTEDVTDEQPVEEDYWLAASEWADSLGAQVISSSLGYLDWYTYEDMDGNTAVTTNAADIAASRNILVATAAGNMGGTAWFHIIAPADADSVLACGAVTNENSVPAFSSRGPTYDGRTKPEVCARGVRTHCATAESPSSYGELSGTSLSTPLVGGAAALVIEAHPDWTAMEVRLALMLTADTAQNPDNERGFGRIRVADAIGFTFVGIDPGDAPPPGSGAWLRIEPQPFTPPGMIELELPAGAAGVRIDIYGPGGRHLARLDDETAGRAGGRRRLGWDGRDAAGRPLAGGVYVVRAHALGWDASAKLVLVR